MIFIPPTDGVRAAMADGLSVVCATCKLYWKGREHGLSGHECAATGRCGSPLRKDVFSEYEGPLLDLANICFACGDRSKYGLTVKGKEQVIGVCAEHLKMFDTEFGDAEVFGGSKGTSPKTLSDLLRRTSVD